MATQLISLECEITKQTVSNAATSYLLSQEYIEVMVPVSLLNILYHRLPINEENFATRYFENVSYKKFKDDSIGIALAQLYRKWIKGFKDAFRKKHLKELILFFHNDETDKVEESFKFRFVYDKDIAKAKVCKDLHIPTEAILKDLKKLEALPKLDMSLSLYVEMFYVAETPKSYSPPYFEMMDKSLTLKSKIEQQNRFKQVVLTKLCTPYHALKCTHVTYEKNSQFLTENDQLDIIIQENINFVNDQKKEQGKNKFERGNSALLENDELLLGTKNGSKKIKKTKETPMGDEDMRECSLPDVSLNKMSDSENWFLTDMETEEIAQVLKKSRQKK